MKPKRSWPGVPKMYSLISESMVMRPKSSATVVTVFAGVCPVRSISAATSVIAASVVRTGISEIAATAVVLPTPNPPAITIFTGIGGRRSGTGGRADGGGRGDSGEVVQSTDHSLDDLRTHRWVQFGTADGEVAGRDQITDENPSDAEVHPESYGYLGDRMWLRT